MKKWVEKLIEQFDFDWNQAQPAAGKGSPQISEERGTLLFFIDIFNKHLLEVEGHPVRKVRETLDEFAKELLSPKTPPATAGGDPSERVLFRLRQFFSTYRIDECAYFQKTFEDFRSIIWDFIDQLSEDIGQGQKEDQEIRMSLDQLKEAVESNSIDVLKNQSRKFIDSYMEKQFKKDKRRAGHIKSIRKNLNSVKKQLGEANDNLRLDHLTQLFNRKTFDEYCEKFHQLFQMSKAPVSLVLLDIDHFKHINDSFGHPIGDFVLKELARTLKDLFNRESDLVARIGGEEFAVLLPDFECKHALVKSEEVLMRIRNEVYVHSQHQIRFTISLGISQLSENETVSSWIKRADLALYHSKNTGRNKVTVAPDPSATAA